MADDNVVPLRPKQKDAVFCRCGDSWVKLTTSAPGASMSTVCPKCGEAITVRS